MAAATDPLRQDAERRGRRAETLALWLLRAKLYRLLARRYRTPAGEIDLIVKRGRTIAFVEVKHRPTADAAREALYARNRQRIARAARIWLSHNPGAAGHDYRFDVVIAASGALPRHIAGVFDSEGESW
ncbi:MAG TPA: YraN family protein [Bauldia sp.]|nr:YraN family protein [Bauldia sp.]